MKGKSLIGVILAAICVTVTYLLPGSEELSHEGITALGVLGMASILWISNTLPFGVTGLLALVMLVLLGVSDMASVFVGFSNSSVIFVITVFCLTAAVMNTKLTLRLINKLLRWAGSSAEKLVLAYMAAAALLSSVMSNVPVTVLFLGLAQPVLKAVGAKPGSSRLGKCLMIGIPFAAVNGGMATPAGSSFNVLAMGVFESIAGKPLTFLQWMAVGLPTAIVATLVCWICLVKIFKPEAINEECSASIREEAENAGKISAYEKKVLFMLVAMPVLWILGTWFPALDVTVVSIIGFVVMFMPGINILTWKQFEESCSLEHNSYVRRDTLTRNNCCKDRRRCISVKAVPCKRRHESEHYPCVLYSRRICLPAADLLPCRSGDNKPVRTGCCRGVRADGNFGSGPDADNYDCCCRNVSAPHKSDICIEL